MIYTVTLNPAIDRTIVLDSLEKGAVNRAVYSRSDIGGKGINVSKVLKSLGMKSSVSGLLGEKNAHIFIEYLKALDIATNFYILEGEIRTNIKIVEQQKSLYTDINEKGFTVGEAEIKAFLETFLKKVKRDDIAVLSGSLPPGSCSGTYEQIIALLNKRGVRTILDAEGEALLEGISAIPYAVKPNIYELKDLMAVDENKLQSVIEGGRKLLKRGIKKVMISMGSRGALYLADHSCLYAAPLKVDIKSTVGAGDAMVAAMAYSIENGLSDYDTLMLSCACGTASIMAEGTKPPSYESIEELKSKIKVENLSL